MEAKGMVVPTYRESIVQSITVKGRIIGALKITTTSISFMRAYPTKWGMVLRFDSVSDFILLGQTKPNGWMNERIEQNADIQIQKMKVDTYDKRCCLRIDIPIIVISNNKYSICK